MVNTPRQPLHGFSRTPSPDLVLPQAVQAAAAAAADGGNCVLGPAEGPEAGAGRPGAAAGELRSFARSLQRTIACSFAATIAWTATARSAALATEAVPSIPLSCAVARSMADRSRSAVASGKKGEPLNSRSVSKITASIWNTGYAALAAPLPVEIGWAAGTRRVRAWR
jgi:hypothetical protein